jgi:hypothetical protein
VPLFFSPKSQRFSRGYPIRITIKIDVFLKYPLVMTNSLLLNMAIEIVDLPIENG